MSKKIERELNGPGWTEVILGATLSLLLGAALAAAFLVFKPVVVVKEIPKDPVAGAVYYIEGSRDSAKARQATAKEKALLQGQPVVVNEDELNALLAPGTPAAPAKPGAKAPATTVEKWFAPGTPNFRIRKNVVQMAVPLRIKAFGFEEQVIAQARGGFEKHGDEFVFEPTEFYLGSCPLNRLPGVGGLLVGEAIASASVPPDLAEAWRKLSSVTVDGSTLHLAMQ